MARKHEEKQADTSSHYGEKRPSRAVIVLVNRANEGFGAVIQISGSGSNILRCLAAAPEKFGPKSRKIIVLFE